MSMSGSNVEQMRQLARQMHTVNDWVLERSTRINKRTLNAGWRGSDAETWKAEVPPQIERSIATLSALLTGAAEQVEAAAAKQSQVSDDPQGPTGPICVNHPGMEPVTPEHPINGWPRPDVGDVYLPGWPVPGLQDPFIPADQLIDYISHPWSPTNGIGPITPGGGYQYRWPWAMRQL